MATRLGAYLHARPWLTWSLTRAVGVALACTALLNLWSFGTDGLAGDVLHTYLPDHVQLAHGYVPYRDFAFEYPPGALPFLYLPGAAVSQFAFLLVYMSQMLLLDASVHRLLRRSGGPSAGAAADLWLYGGALTGGLLLCRNDLPACAAVVAGLLALRSGRTIRAGVLFALGAAVKIWPAELLALLAGWGRHWIRAVAAAGILLGAAFAPFALIGAGHGLVRDLIGYHGSRGVEIESVAALPQVVVAAVTGRPLHLSYDHASLNLPHSAAVSDACTVLVLAVAAAAIGWLLHARLRRRQVDFPRLALLATWLVGANLIVTKVFSPQYMLWLLAVAAIGVQAGVLHRLDRQLLLGAVLATTLEYPFTFSSLGQGGATALAPAIFLSVRDGLLLWLVARWTIRLTHHAGSDAIPPAIPANAHHRAEP